MTKHEEILTAWVEYYLFCNNNYKAEKTQKQLDDIRKYFSNK